jgi:hypothetical protein
MKSLKQNLRGGLLVGIGYMLSPLSWWNDVFFNLPIAIAVGYAISWLHPSWFVPGTLAGYWLSNVVGMVMMQFGATDIFWRMRDAILNVIYSSGLAVRHCIPLPCGPGVLARFRDSRFFTRARA